MKILFIGDIFGEAGRDVVAQFLPTLRQIHKPDLVIANAENAAGGFGLTPTVYKELKKIGIDVLTGGNHTFDKKEGVQVLTDEPHVLRPANYPLSVPGRGDCVFETSSNEKVAILNLMGRTFMDPPIDCPFHCADTRIVELKKQTPIIFVDFHAETTSEKGAMAWHLDGKVSALVGTHTHIQTADERIFPQGLGFISDVGMTGPYDSVIGVRKDIVIERHITRLKRRMEAATLDPWFCGVLVEISSSTSQCIKIERIRIELNRPETHPRVS